MYANLETLRELAERWRVPMSWIYSRTRETGPDALPRVRVGKYLRFIPADVDRWLEKKNRKAA